MLVFPSGKRHSGLDVQGFQMMMMMVVVVVVVMMMMTPSGFLALKKKDEPSETVQFFNETITVDF